MQLYKVANLYRSCVWVALGVRICAFGMFWHKSARITHFSLAALSKMLRVERKVSRVNFQKPKRELDTRNVTQSYSPDQLDDRRQPLKTSLHINPGGFGGECILLPRSSLFLSLSQLSEACLLARIRHPLPPRCLTDLWAFCSDPLAGSESSHLVARYSRAARCGAASLLFSTTVQVELHVAAFRWCRKYRNSDRSQEQQKKTTRVKGKVVIFFPSSSSSSSSSSLAYISPVWKSDGANWGGGVKGSHTNIWRRKSCCLWL